jgi:hypothetical protein
MGVDLDNLSEEEDYLSALMEAVNTLTIKNASDPRISPLQQEILKVRKKRKAADPKFKAKKTKISANSFKKGSATTASVGQKALPPAIKPKTSIIPYQKPDEVDEEEGGKKKKRQRKPKEKNLLAEIAKSVTNIAGILKDQYKLKKKEGEFDRKKSQRDKRKLQEAGLEKRFQGLFKTAQKIIEPVRSLFDKIFGFLFNVLLAKFLTKIVDWIANPENQKKIQSIIRFFGDHWKKLLSLYLVFGTGLGKFVLGLSKLLITGAVKLGIAVAKLAAAKGVGGARKLARMLGGKKAKFLIGAASTAVTVGGTMMAVDSVTGSGGNQTQGFSGGGLAQPKIQPTPQEVKKDSPKGMSSAIKGAAFGSMFGPMGALAGAGIGSLFDKFSKKDDTVTLSKPASVELEVPSGTEGGVDGPGGTDKVPAMLTAGEFVMSRGAVQKYGVKTLEGMNSAGGGTNQPKVIKDKVYAKEGGYIGDREKAPDKQLIPNDLFSGFRGQTSRSENYSVRAINEVVKRVYNLINADRERERREGYPPPYSGERTPPSSRPNIPGAGVAEEVYNRGKDFIGGISDTYKPKVDEAIDAAMPQVQALPSTIDYGSLYLKSQLGGMGGAITEADLSQSTKDEYTRAYQVAMSKLPQRRASVESVIRQQQNILNTPGITEDQKRNAQRTLAINRSRLAKYDAGQVDVQYVDFQVDGKLSPTAAAAQKTMGAVWASDTGDGGFKIEKEPYDFPIVKDPISLMNWKKLSEKEKHAWLDKQDPNNSVRKKLDPRPPYKGSLGAWGKQDIAEAMYSLNPAAAPMVTDVKIGGSIRPEAIADSALNALESIPVFGQASSFTRGLAMNMLFGKTRDVTKGPFEGAAGDSLYRKVFPELTDNDKALQAKRPMWDMFGLFGGATAEMERNRKPFYGPGGDPSGSGRGQAQASRPSPGGLDSGLQSNKGSNKGYFSSTTGQFYASYAEALKDPRVAEAAQLEKTKKRLSFAPQNPNVLTPQQPLGNNIQVINVGGNQQQQDKSNNDRGGSQTPQVNAGSGDQGKWKIFGMSWPF